MKKIRKIVLLSLSIFFASNTVISASEPVIGITTSKSCDELREMLNISKEMIKEILETSDDKLPKFITKAGNSYLINMNDSLFLTNDVVLRECSK